MANDAITASGLFGKFGDSATRSCWKLARSHIADAAKAAGETPVNRVILFYGGANPENNHRRYYENLQDIIKSLKSKGCVDSENITVMYADGLDNEADLNLTQNPKNPSLINSDLQFLRNEGIAVIPATKDGLENMFSILKDNIKETDHTLFYAFDHGDRSWFKESLIGWNQEKIMDKDFAEIVQGTPGYKTYVFAECHAGGMAEAIDLADGKTCAIAATKPHEVSYGDGFAGGVAEKIAEDGITTKELFTGARDLDIYADETGIFPQFLFNVEHPQIYGKDFPVFYQPNDVSSFNSQNADKIETDDIEAICGYGGGNGLVYDDDTADGNELPESSYPDADFTETDDIDAIAEYDGISSVEADDELDAFDDTDDMDDYF